MSEEQVQAIQERYTERGFGEITIRLCEAGTAARTKLLAEMEEHLAAWKAGSTELHMVEMFVAWIGRLTIRVSPSQQEAEQEGREILDLLRRLERSRKDVPVLLALLREQAEESVRLRESAIRGWQIARAFQHGWSVRPADAELAALGCEEEVG